MGVKTPDAYRIGAGQVTREYPADAVPARLCKQPSLPTMSRAPESSPVEQVVTAEVAVVRRKASVPPRQSTDSHTSKDAATPTQRNDVASSAAPSQAQHRAEPSAPAREFAHLDEAGVSCEADQHPGVPVHRDWHRTTMRVVNPAGESTGEQRAESVPTVPPPTKSAEASRVGGASRAQVRPRRSGVGESRMDRRGRPAHRGHRHRGLVMFLLGFISALLIVAAVVGGLFVARSTGSSGFANAVDSCHAGVLHTRLAGDGTSLTLEAFSDSGNSLTTPVF